MTRTSEKEKTPSYQLDVRLLIQRTIPNTPLVYRQFQGLSREF